jgi:hypothetical protein
MSERLSSSATLYYKVILPALWITMFGYGTLAMWLGYFPKPSQPPEEVKLVFLVVWLACSAFLMIDTMRLKTVTLDNDDLVIKNFTAVIRVPLRNINHISESRFTRPKTVSLSVYPPCEYGEKITFIPRPTFQISFKLWGEHPIVMKLRQLTGVLK